MIDNNTLFILGAGASKPYGLYTGAELNRQFWVSGGDPTHWSGILVRALGIDGKEVAAFSRAFLLSKSPSIDAFLATRTEFADIGKFAIAASLLTREIPGLVHQQVFDPDWDDWYAVLWAHMREGASRASDIFQSNVRFITFNYDRSLEYFLHHAAKETFGLNDADAEVAWKSLNLIHMYGQLGSFSHEHRRDVRPYNPEISVKSLEIAANGIKIIPEAREDDQSFVKAREWIRWAHRICFLGFGFDPLNIQRLQFMHSAIEGNQLSRHKQIVASVHGKYLGEIARIQRTLLGKEITNGGQGIFDNGGMTVSWEHYEELSSTTLRESRIFV